MDEVKKVDPKGNLDGYKLEGRFDHYFTIVIQLKK